ncbi:metallophosphoesterase family protein [Exiguobacterium indicum]|uniref:metallophosphoesterase family protein n=1 Tax=Exiguobacterium indicum TaxID=296995 RepID=UPI002B259CDE|nr:metallophosphoesterase family protein [Exiguobacterium indicum]
MKVMLFTDIHGNASALRAVLSYLDQQPDIDAVYCLGDLVGIGPEHNEVIDLLKQRPDIQTISGNHDECVLALIHGETYPDSYRHAKEHHQWIADTLTQENQKYLERLPRVLNIMHQEQTMHLTHYAYADKTKKIGEEPLKQAVDGTKENLSVLFAGSEARIIGFGHHHPAQQVETGQTLFINPGALGCQETAIAPVAIIDWEKDQVRSEILKIPYDDRPFLDVLNTTEMPERELMRRLFFGSRT